MRATTLPALTLILCTPALIQAQPATQPAATPPASMDTSSTNAPPTDNPPSGEPAAAHEAHEGQNTSASPWDKVSLSTLWYLSYASGKASDESYNRFFIGRGYLTLKLKPVKWFEPRVTLDAHQDDQGSWGVRLKYLYGKFVAPLKTAVISKPSLELGLVHGPWFDYEEHINGYRAQGTMLLERNKLLNSADLGATVTVLLGKPLPDEYQHTVSHEYPGTWGSIQLGLYNGGGYHAEEANENKVFASRISLRPAGPWLPNLQLSYLLLTGKGNSEQTPKWLINHFMASFEHQYFTLMAQIGLGEGNQKGDKLDQASGDPLDWLGYSFFGEAKLPCIKSSLIARLDRFDWDRDGGDPVSTRLIAGYAFHFLPGNFILLSVDRLSYSDSSVPTDWQAMATLQVHYPAK